MSDDTETEPGELEDIRITGLATARIAHHVAADIFIYDNDEMREKQKQACLLLRELIVYFEREPDDSVPE